MYENYGFSLSSLETPLGLLVAWNPIDFIFHVVVFQNISLTELLGFVLNRFCIGIRGVPKGRMLVARNLYISYVSSTRIF